MLDRENYDIMAFLRDVLTGSCGVKGTHERNEQGSTERGFREVH